MASPKLPISPIWRFIIDCASSGTVAGFTTLLVTYSIEHFGGVVGGIVGTIPSNIVVSAIGLFFLETQESINVTMGTVPIGMLLCLVVLLLWRILPPRLPRTFSSERRLIVMLLICAFVWMILAFGIVELVEEMDNLQILDLRWIGCCALAFYFVVASLVVFVPVLPVGRKGDEQVSCVHLFVRFLAGFGATVVSILLATWNEYAGGVALAFPSVILTSLCSLWISQEETVSTSAASPLILGSTANSIFAILFAWAAPTLEYQVGPLAGLALTIASVWFVSVYGFSIPMVFLLRKKEIASANKVSPIVITEVETETDTDVFTKIGACT